MDSAGDMIAKRLDEIAALESLLARGGHTRAERNALRARIKASKANLASWHKYIATDAPADRRAVVIPD